MPEGPPEEPQQPTPRDVPPHERMGAGQQYLDQAQALANVGNWYIDITNGQLEWSDEVYKIFEVPKGTPVTHDEFMDAIHPADRPLVEARWDAAKAGEPYQVTHRIRVGGQTKWVDQQARIEFDEDGEPVAGLGVVQDVTERREREQLLRVTDRLLRHNLRNDLTVIRGNAASIRDGEGDSVSERAETIVQMSDNMLRMGRKARTINEVVEHDIDAIPLDIGSAVAEQIKTVSEAFPEAGITLSSTPKCGVSAIPQIEEAIAELLRNAIVHNDREHPQVEVTIQEEGDNVRVTIADDGPEIPAIERRIVTHDRTIDSVNHGSGLGLWMVHWIVHRSSGMLDFATRDGRGNEVTITLERAAPH